MLRRQHDPHEFVDHRLHHEPITFTEWWPNKRDVDRAAFQPFDEVWCVALFGRQHDIRIALAKGPDDFWHERLEIGGAGEADLDTPDLSTRPALDTCLGLLHLIEDPARVVEQQSA